MSSVTENLSAIAPLNLSSAVAVNEHVNTPISTDELERRWAAVRAAMADADIDVLVMQNNNDKVGGYGKYFTDIPEIVGYPTTVVFPRLEAMKVIMHGPLNSVRELPPEGDGLFRGVDRVYTDGAFPTASYTALSDPRNVVKALQPWTQGTIGLLGKGQMSWAMGEHLLSELSSARFVDASDIVDPIKAIKSAEEQDLVRRCAAIQDDVMRAVFKAVRPGRRGSDVMAEARFVSEELGAEAGVFLCGSAPPGTPPPVAARHVQHRVIQEGDIVSVLVECNGPGGMYAELGRTCVLGDIPAQLEDELAFLISAQAFTVDLLRPGTAPADVWEQYNAYMREHGRPEEDRLHSHNQGYDLVERPLIRHDETMPIAAGMNFAAHPCYIHDEYLSWICDNWLIGPDGPGERLHRFPQEITVLR
ncbi:M24 family metallopeptidase [Mycolicibacterium stellerae]|uniref:M24 family metallopeptidase n=1 Tax=Mycolicibacterium stellerae TaxID=2358193 RepID=UPI000F0B731E|nr:M24 family metallopeptidase [Mycolicibacterium stellerae]